ncbi:MAG: porin [Sandaracinaceae bacterium]|nr:porin [Sandaracinaceae bacterium]
MKTTLRLALVTSFISLSVGSASAQSAPDAAETPPPFTLSGYAEAYYSYNFNQPSNGITAFRGFDSRHNSFAISNVALDAQWDAHNVVGRVMLQVGQTPSTYYLGETSIVGGGGVAGGDASLWKYIQQAYAGYRFGTEHPLLVSGGLFLSPIGPESIPVRDSWNWSRSNLFFGLPFYHVGARAALNITDEWVATLGVYNGWNSALDNNPQKSIQAQLTYNRPDHLSVSMLYMGGTERNAGAAEGKPWRHLFDAYALWTVNTRLSLMLHGDVGFEPNTFGTSSWAAAAAYARVKLVDGLFVAARADVFYEHLAANASGSASPIFFPASWVSSGTLTLEARPADHVSFRLEFRHDQAASQIYYGGDVSGDGTSMPFLANSRAQNTLTLGATAWF